jgi:hypothetical protein
MTSDGALVVLVNDATTATVRQGDRVRFEVRSADGPVDELEVDYEGAGDWRAVSGPEFVRVYPRAGRFAAVVRAGNLCATVNVRVTRVTGTGGAGFF